MDIIRSSRMRMYLQPWTPAAPVERRPSAFQADQRTQRPSLFCLCSTWPCLQEGHPAIPPPRSGLSLFVSCSAPWPLPLRLPGSGSPGRLTCVCSMASIVKLQICSFESQHTSVRLTLLTQSMLHSCTKVRGTPSYRSLDPLVQPTLGPLRHSGGSGIVITKSNGDSPPQATSRTRLLGRASVGDGRPDYSHGFSRRLYVVFGELRMIVWE